MTRILPPSPSTSDIGGVVRRIIPPAQSAGDIRRVVRLRALGGILIAALVSAALAGAALAQPPAPAAQLHGTFQMSGTVTVAQLVSGESAGEAIQRTWTFMPLCATAPCATVRLVRTRATGTDTLKLTAVAPNTYSGTGRFYAPLRCSGRIYRPGEVIPFQIKVRVTATAPGTDGVPSVTGISARYVNTSRLDLTPCLALLGHDAARYTGQLVTG